MTVYVDGLKHPPLSPLSPRPPEHWRHRVWEPQRWSVEASDIAVHEAGHVVVGELLGMPVHDAAVGANGTGRAGVLGSVAKLATDAPAPPVEFVVGHYLELIGLIWHGIDIADGVIRYATMLAAGRQAEMMAAGVALSGVLEINDADHLQARGLLAAINERHATGYCQRLARHLLADNWHAVESISAKLRGDGYWSAGERHITFVPGVKVLPRPLYAGNAHRAAAVGSDSETH